MDRFPTNLALADDGALLIKWDDGREDSFAPGLLRKACPCATCREKRKAEAAPSDPMELTILSPAEAQPTVIQGMTPVGNYAYTIAFSDGHDTGIFTLEHLRALGDSPS